MQMLAEIFKTPARVLIVDNNERVRSVYQELIKHWGFQPVVARGEGLALLRDAREKAREERCQLAVVDMRLIDDLDEEDTSGLQLIAAIKPAVSVVVSAAGSLPNFRASDEAGASAFVGKGEGPKLLREELESAALIKCAARRGLVIEPADVLEHIAEMLCAKIPAAYHDQIIDVFGELFPHARQLRLEKLGIDPLTQVSTAPRPKSVVLKVYEDGLQPVIVKLARAHKIKVEAEKYYKYINGHLVGRYNPMLLDSKPLWDIGGTKFSYVGTTEQVFSQYLQQQSLENIKLCLERFFSIGWSDNYERAVEIKNTSLFELYSVVWGDEWIERTRKMLDTDFGKNLTLTQTMHAPSMARINPLTWLLEKVADNKEQDASRIAQTFTAVTHGDLHGDNLLVDQDHNAWVIDFERSGEGHILQDFIELESDIINRLKCNAENFDSFYQLCLAVTGPARIDAIARNPLIRHSEFVKALEVIAILRSLAAQCTQLGDAREYLLGLLFNTIFRATIIGDDQVDCRKRALMLASILCHRLDHQEGIWPPQDWQRFS